MYPLLLWTLLCLAALGILNEVIMKNHLERDTRTLFYLQLTDRRVASLSNTAREACEKHVLECHSVHCLAGGICCAGAFMPLHRGHICRCYQFFICCFCMYVFKVPLTMYSAIYLFPLHFVFSFFLNTSTWESAPITFLFFCFLVSFSSFFYSSFLPFYLQPLP